MCVDFAYAQYIQVNLNKFIISIQFSDGNKNEVCHHVSASTRIYIFPSSILISLLAQDLSHAVVGPLRVCVVDEMREEKAQEEKKWENCINISPPCSFSLATLRFFPFHPLARRHRQRERCCCCRARVFEVNPSEAQLLAENWLASIYFISSR